MTDRESEFLSKSSVYRILKAADLIEGPTYILMQAGDQFEHPTRRRNELWQTDFTYLPVVGWGWYYLSTVLDDYSRKILAWKLGPTQLEITRCSVEEAGLLISSIMLIIHLGCYAVRP